MDDRDCVDFLQWALLKKCGQIEGLSDTRTTLVLETVKESQAIPVEQLTRHLNRGGG